MKIGIVGTGSVGCASAMAAAVRGSAREIVLVNRTRKTAEAVATDIRYGVPVGRKVDLIDGDYADLKDARVVLVTSGVNAMTHKVVSGYSERTPKFTATSCRRSWTLRPRPYCLS